MNPNLFHFLGPFFSIPISSRKPIDLCPHPSIRGDTFLYWLINHYISPTFYYEKLQTYKKVERVSQDTLQLSTVEILVCFFPYMFYHMSIPLLTPYLIINIISFLFHSKLRIAVHFTPNHFHVPIINFPYNGKMLTQPTIQGQAQSF